MKTVLKPMFGLRNRKKREEDIKNNTAEAKHTFFIPKRSEQAPISGLLTVKMAAKGIQKAITSRELKPKIRMRYCGEYKKTRL